MGESREIKKLKQYLRREMKKVCIARNPTKIDDIKFFFCWGQAKFDVLMDIDLQLKLGVFMKRSIPTKR